MNSGLSNSSSTGGASLEVHLLGMVDFDACLFLQERLVAEIGERDDGQGALLVCEHPPLITVGREGSLAHILCEPAELVARQLEVRWLNRGGGCLVHAPGQLAVYPILPLQRRGMGLSAYRQAVEGAAVDLCRELKIPAHTGNEPGVWCRSGQVAHLGAAVKSWISYHGLFVNVSPAMDWLRLVRPNVAETRLTSLAAERLQPVTMHAARESLIRNLAARCGYERYHLYTGHPLLRRTKRVCIYA